MSAWIVSKRHIDTMVRTEQERRKRYRTAYSYDELTELGRMLWCENLKSVAYRYPDDKSGQRPGQVGSDDEIKGYTFSADGVEVLEPVALLKAVACYEYQSCEHPGWCNSKAAKLCRELQGHLIGCLPGYSEAAWGIE